jgi:hypothetical protein
MKIWLRIQDELLRGFLCALWFFGLIFSCGGFLALFAELPEWHPRQLIFYMFLAAITVVAFFLHQRLIEEGYPRIERAKN